MCLVNTKAVEFVKSVTTIRRESIATNAKRNIIDHMESIGMKRMCAKVSLDALQIILFCFLWLLQIRQSLQDVTVTTFIQREIVRKKQDVVNVGQNSKNLIVENVRSVTLDTQIVEHANVI